MPLIVKLQFFFHHHHLARAWPTAALWFYFYLLPMLSLGHTLSLLGCHSCCCNPESSLWKVMLGLYLPAIGEALNEK